MAMFCGGFHCLIWSTGEGCGEGFLGRTGCLRLLAKNTAAKGRGADGSLRLILVGLRGGSTFLGGGVGSSSITYWCRAFKPSRCRNLTL